MVAVDSRKMSVSNKRDHDLHTHSHRFERKFGENREGNIIRYMIANLNIG
jgi:hypothetical protein